MARNMFLDVQEALTLLYVTLIMWDIITIMDDTEAVVHRRYRRSVARGVTFPERSFWTVGNRGWYKVFT